MNSYFDQVQPGFLQEKEILPLHTKCLYRRSDAAAAFVLSVWPATSNPVLDAFGCLDILINNAGGSRRIENGFGTIRLDQGFSHELPYPEASFDRVFSTFMFHHLLVDKREKTLCEIQRVLTPGGFFHMLDFAGTEASGYGPLARHFHSSRRLRDNSGEQILTLMNRVGFVSCEKVMEGAMFFGSLRIAYYKASAPMLGGQRHLGADPDQ